LFFMLFILKKIIAKRKFGLSKKRDEVEVK